MIRSTIAAAAAAALALACAACSSTGSGPAAAQKAVDAAIQDGPAIRAGVERGVAGTATAIAATARLGVVDPAKLRSLRADLGTACASLQIGREVFAATGQAGSADLTAAQAQADTACAAADTALAAVGG